MHLRAALVILLSLACAHDFDIVIRNGRIVDGTGDPSFIGDVAIAAAGLSHSDLFPTPGPARNRCEGFGRRARFHRHP